MYILKYFVIVFLLLLKTCDKEQPGKIQGEIIQKFEKEGLLDRSYSFSANTEIMNPSNYLLSFNDDEETYQIPDNYRREDIEKSIILKEKITIKNDKKDPEFIIHYSNMYQYENILFICVFIGIYEDDPTISNSYNSYRGDGVEVLVTLEEDFTIKSIKSKQVIYDR